MPRNRVLAAGAATAGVTGIAALAGRYARGVARAGRSWSAEVEAGLRDFDEVGEVSIVPLVERLTSGGGLRGESGVSYLISAGGRRVLFDSGLTGGKLESALAHNARLLGVRLADLDAVVISHLHADHVGGLGRCAAGPSFLPPRRLSHAGCRPTCPPR